MSARKARNTSIAFFLVLLLSMGSLGFLIGQAHKNTAVQAGEQVQQMTSQVQHSGAIIGSVAKHVRNLLIQ